MICVGGPLHTQHHHGPIAERLMVNDGFYRRHDFVLVWKDWGGMAHVWGWWSLTDEQVRRGAEVLNEWEWSPIPPYVSVTDHADAI